MLEQQIDQDLKAALLAGDKLLVITLRSIKNSILYAKVASGGRDHAMPDDTIISLLQKEAKKRQESADLYLQGGNQEKATSELAEKTIIEKYLPTPLSEAEVAEIVDGVIGESSAQNPAAMGHIIAEVRRCTAGRADGALIARLVKDRLS